MYQITDSILKSGVYSALTEPTREFQQRISFGEGSGANFIKHISFIKGITKIEISQEGNSDSSGLVLGSCCASSCVAEFYNPDRTYNYAGKTMFIECGVKYPFKVSYEDKTGGYYMTSNGKWVDGENVYSKVTNLIPVFEGDSFVYTGRGEWGAASVLWYDENKSFLSGEEYYSEDTRDHVTTVKIEAPEGAAWAVFQTFDYDSDVTLEVSKANDSFFYIPCGYYKVDKPETDDDWRTVSITAYDCIDEMTGKWNTSLSMPSNAYLLLEEIATRYRLALEVESGVLAEMKSRMVTEAQALALTAYTEREVCGFLAGLFGANARVNTVGKLAVKRYQNSPTDDFCILAAVQWQNGFKKSSEEEFVVNSVTSGIDDAVFTAGTGAGISFSNPIITEDEISAVYDVYADVSFQPSSCEWRGNPCVECGDTVAVTDRNGNSYTVLVASQVIDLTGGLSMNTHCPGGDSEISFDTVDERTRAALNRQYTALQQAIIDASNALNGARGGYYEVLDNDNDGNPDGWLIKQFQDGSGGLIRANYEGIGLSLDGGKNYRTAIGFNGINADCITTGKLNAERIDTSTLVVGLGNVDGLNAELAELLEAANEADKKADNAQTTADTASSTASTASTNASNALSAADSAKNALVNLCTDNNMTLINGAKIYTGSIAANSIDVSKLSAGTGELINSFYNEDFSESSNGVPGWDGFNALISRQSGYVNVEYTLTNLLSYDESEFYTRETWTATNCTITNPHPGVDYIKVTPNNTSDWAIISTSVRLENGKRYSISAQINPQGWSSTNSSYTNNCIGYHCNGSFSNYSSYTNFSPSTGEVNVEWVFDYTGTTGVVDIGLYFRGMQTDSGGVASVNIAWVGVCAADGRNKRFYSSKKEWIKSTYQSSSLINNGSYLSSADKYIAYISNNFTNTYNNQLQIFFQKKRMEKNKRYVIVSRIRVVNLSAVNSGAMLAVWGQNSTGAAYTPTGISINNKSESSSYVTVKFVFDYVGETGLTDVGICWRGLMNGSSPCQIRFHWMQLYQDDTADTGFYCSHSSWLDEDYNESNLIPNSESVDEYNQKTALYVENDNLYFFGKVQSATGDIGFLNYTLQKVLSETSSSLYLDASLTDLSEPDFYESSLEIAKPNGVLDQATGMASFAEIYGAHKQVKHEYASFKSIYTVQTGDEKFVSLVSGLGLNARDQSGGVLYSAKGIVIDATTELTRDELKALKKLVE